MIQTSVMKELNHKHRGNVCEIFCRRHLQLHKALGLNVKVRASDSQFVRMQSRWSLLVNTRNNVFYFLLPWRSWTFMAFSVNFSLTGLQGWLYPAISKKIFFSAWKIVGFRCVYRTLSNIYDATFFKRMPCTILWFVSGSRKTRYNLWLISYWNQAGIWLPYFLWCFDFIVKFQYNITPHPPKKKKKSCF